MIVLRRLLIPPLLVIFIVFLFPLMLFTYVHSVLLDSEFYVTNYTSTNLSERFYNNILPNLMDDTLPGQLVGENYDLSDDVHRILIKTIPRSWVDKFILATLQSFIPYLTGVNDSASVHLDIKTLTDQLIIELKNDDFKKDIYTAVITSTVEDVHGRVKNAGELPLSIKLEKSDIELFITSLLYYQWYETNYDTTIDTAYAYLIGETEELELNILLKSNIGKVIDPFKQILRDQNVYSMVLDKAGISILSQFDLNSFDLPQGFLFNSDSLMFENIEGVGSSLDKKIVNNIGDDIVDQLYLYLIGKSKSLDVSIDMKELKPKLNQIITAEIEKQLESSISQLPVCDFETTLALLSQNITEIPDCYPGKLSSLPDSPEMRFMLSTLGIDFDKLYIYDKMLEEQIDTIKSSVLSELQVILNNNIPTNYVFSEQELKSYLSVNQINLIDQIRLWATTGLNFDQEYVNEFYVGLRGHEDTSESQENHIGKIQTLLASGYTITEKDLQPHLDSYLDTALVRKVIKLTGNIYINIALYTLAILSIITIGLLGGRTWYGRLGWGAIPTLITATIAFTFLNGGYSLYLKNVINQIINDAAKAANLKSLELVYTEIGDVGFLVINSFINNLNNILIPIIVISFLLFANAVIMHRRKLKQLKQ